MEFRVVSTETIKPSSPTPNHLRTFKFNLLDQFAPLIYTPYLFFYYPASDQARTGDKLERLKDSLSKALTRFYPLAGRIKDQTSIDCNDEGALFIEAEVSHEMLEFLSPPKIQLLNNLLPCQPICKEAPESSVQVAVKANVFACGGIAIGVSVLHKLIDGYTFSIFVKEWSSICAQYDCDKELWYAHNEIASLFPSSEHLCNDDDASSWRETNWPKEATISTRRFVFEAAAMSRLKDKARSEQVPNPTRTEAILGLVWKSVMNASRLVSGSQKPSAFIVAMNLRPRLKSELPDFSVGNMVWSGLARSDEQDQPEIIELHRLVNLLRESVAKVDNDFVEKLQGKEGHAVVFKRLEKMGEVYSATGAPVYAVSSFVKMGFYEVDFGWGRPNWVSVIGFTEAMFMNSVVLMEGSGSHDDDDGGDEKIEVWVTLNQDEMAVLEQDMKFLSYATKNPPVMWKKMCPGSLSCQKNQKVC